MMRPDELSNLEEMERSERMGNRFRSAAQTAIGLGSLAGAGVASKVLPFINEFIPSDLAIKGISKVSPSIGNFLKKGQQAGLDIQQGLQFVKEKITPTTPEKNIVEQYSPELHQFIMDEINAGRSVLEAGALATLGKKGMPNFKKIIEKITKDHKAPWSAILQTIYGQQQSSKPQQQQQQQPPQQGGGDKWSEITKTLQDLLKS